MKQSPQTKKLEALLRSSKLSADGFMGTDNRPLQQIIDADLAEIAHSDYTTEKIAARMHLITETAKKALGYWVCIDDARQVRIAEAKGAIPCPWPHNVSCAKRVTILKETATGREIRWSDLNIHLIAEHGFFEGKGSPFRVVPVQLIDMIS